MSDKLLEFIEKWHAGLPAVMLEDAKTLLAAEPQAAPISQFSNDELCSEYARRLAGSESELPHELDPRKRHEYEQPALLSAEQVREAMRKAARQGFGCSYYDEDRLTAELNALLAAAPPAAYTMPSGHGAWCAATGDSTAKCSCGLEQREAEIRNAALENVAKIFSGSMRAWTPFEIIERILALKVASGKPDPMDGSRETNSAGERK